MVIVRNRTPGRDKVSAPKDSTRVLKATIQRLRKLALEAEDGSFLGAEPDLLALLGVSRPTFRQAARLIEHEQLVIMRMGPQGGCYASRPNVQTTARAAATYLQVGRASLLNMLNVTHALNSHAITQAANCTDEARRADLQAFLDVMAGEAAVPSLKDFLERERRFWQVILAMAENAALDLFLLISQKFVDRHPASQKLLADKVLMRARRGVLLGLGEAVLAGDGAAALAITVQQFDAFQALLPDEALQDDVIDANAMEDWG